MNIGLKLKELRLNKGYTQKQIAENLGISEQSYQRYESESHNPTIDKLIELARFFEVSIDYLVGETNDPTRR